MRRARGFTLAEMLVTLAVTGIAFSLVLLAFLSQHRTFEALEVGRATQEAGRDALLALERSLRMAGYGVDPRFAFDFREYRCATPPCRDRVDRPDELVFMSRSARYRMDPTGGTCTRVPGCFTGDAWNVDAVDATSVTVQARAGDVIRKGQVLLVACQGARRSTMVTVAQTLPAAAADGALVVPLQPAQAGKAYRANDLADTCYSTGFAAAFRLERSRWFVDSTGLDAPYLLLDSGLDLDGDQRTPDEGDLDDLLPIVRGVDDFQVSYGLEPYAGKLAPDSDRNWLIGDERARVEEPDPTLLAPDYATAPEDARRFTLHPANIRAVRISLIARSQRSDPGPPATWPGDPFGLFENRSVVPTALGRLRRSPARVAVAVRNLASRSLFLF